MDGKWLGVVIATVLIGGLWLMSAFWPDGFQHLDTVLPTATSLVALTISVIGAVAGTKAAAAAGEGRWKDATGGGVLVIAGAILALVSSALPR